MIRKLQKYLAAAAAAVILLSLYFMFPGEPVKITIPEGAGAGQVASILRREGIVFSSTWFRVLVKLTGTGRKLMPGDYPMRRHMSAEEALWRMTHSVYVSSIKIVIPEGWRMEQVAERLEANGVTQVKPFLALAREQKMEGYLFPSTYYLKKNTPPQEVINLLRYEFDRQIRPLFSKGFPQDMDEKKTMIIASIVEREAVDDDEPADSGGVHKPLPQGHAARGRSHDAVLAGLLEERAHLRGPEVQVPVQYVRRRRASSGSDMQPRLQFGSGRGRPRRHRRAVLRGGRYRETHLQRELRGAQEGEAPR